MPITIKTEGRRHYLLGDTYPIKDALRGAGCKWDATAKAWWTGKRETAEDIVQGLAEGKIQQVAQFTKLPDGTWGVWVSGTPTTGAEVEVDGKFGRSKVTIATVLDTVDGRALCSIRRKERKSYGRIASKRSNASSRCKECRGPLVNAPHHRAMGGLCGECAFDEFDM